MMAPLTASSLGSDRVPRESCSESLAKALALSRCCEQSTLRLASSSLDAGERVDAEETWGWRD